MVEVLHHKTDAGAPDGRPGIVFLRFARIMQLWSTHFFSLSLVNLVLAELSMRRIGNDSAAFGCSDAPDAVCEVSGGGA